MILYVVRYHPALTETFVRDEIRALAADGVQIELAAFDPRDAGVVDDAGVRVHRRPHRWSWIAALPGLFLEWLRAPGWIRPRVLWLTSLVRRSRRVHVHFAGEAAEWAMEACRRAGVPYSVTVHAVDLYKPRPGLPAVLRAARAVVAMTGYNRRLLADRYGVRATLVRYGIDVEEALERPDAEVPGRPVLLSVGRNVPKKGFDILARAAAICARDLRVVLYSDAAPLEFVDVRPLAPHPEVLAAMRSAHAFVLPCRVADDGDMDGLPVVIVEAMAAGLPVVTTPVSGIPEVVDESVGWLVPSGDVEALAVAMRAAVHDPEEARRRGRAAHARVIDLGFSRHHMVRAMRGVLEV